MSVQFTDLYRTNVCSEDFADDLVELAYTVQQNNLSRYPRSYSISLNKFRHRQSSLEKLKVTCLGQNPHSIHRVLLPVSLHWARTAARPWLRLALALAVARPWPRRTSPLVAPRPALSHATLAAPCLVLLWAPHVEEALMPPLPAPH
jgi:hypothetical protein